jgi:hypothetical protein
LVYAFVSDEGEKENFMSKTNEQWISALSTFKADASQINARAIVNSAATRLIDIAKGVNANESAPNGSDIGDSRVTRDIHGSFADTLNDLAINVSTQNKNFALKGKPVPETLEVFINNVKVDSTWSFNGAQNMLNFSEDNAPDFGSKLEIRYEPMLVLSKTPNENALEVRVNDQVVEKSTSNGWSLVSGENRIRFNGSSIPSNGSQIRVIFQGE